MVPLARGRTHHSLPRRLPAFPTSNPLSILIVDPRDTSDTRLERNWAGRWCSFVGVFNPMNNWLSSYILECFGSTGHADFSDMIRNDRYRHFLESAHAHESHCPQPHCPDSTPHGANILSAHTHAQVIPNPGARARLCRSLLDWPLRILYVILAAWNRQDSLARCADTRVYARET